MSRVRRVLIVSPHFPPVNAPDMQRVRMSLPHFVAAGWEVTVLTVADPTPLAPVEPELLATVPAGVQIVRSHCCSRRWTGWLGVNNVALRALPFLFLRGCRLLASRRFDVVYFSTTMFIVLPFGRLWRLLYGVPYVVDLQDPWVSDFYERPGAPPPPGAWKYRVVRGLNRLLEGWTLRRAAHLIAVSPDYPESLRTRYPYLANLPSTVLAFGSPDADLARLRSLPGPVVLPPGGFRVGFAGALSPGMMPALQVLLAAVQRLRQEGHPISVHLHGTSYAGQGRGRAMTATLSVAADMKEWVCECPDRLPYLQALQLTLEADANLVLGSEDPGFIPSKLAALLAARRPVIAIVHERSALARRLAELGLKFTELRAARKPSEAVDDVVAALREMTTGRGDLPPPPPPDLMSAATAAIQLQILAAAGARDDSGSPRL